MPLSQDEKLHQPTENTNKSKILTYTIEWLIWVLFAGILYSQTEIFNQPIAEYKFGASGWPRVICLAVVSGGNMPIYLPIISCIA